MSISGSTAMTHLGWRLRRHGGEDRVPRLALVARRHRDHDVDLHAARAVDRDVADRRELRLELAQDRGLERDLLQDMVLGDRLAGQQALEDRALAMRDRRDLRHGLGRGRRVVAGIFAERTFDLLLVGVDRELDHDLRVRRHLHVVADRLDELDRRTAQAAGDEPVVGRRRSTAPGRRTWSSDPRRSRAPRAAAFPSAWRARCSCRSDGSARRTRPAPSVRGPGSGSCRYRGCRSRDSPTPRCPPVM